MCRKREGNMIRDLVLFNPSRLELEKPFSVLKMKRETEAVV